MSADRNLQAHVGHSFGTRSNSRATSSATARTPSLIISATVASWGSGRGVRLESPLPWRERPIGVTDCRVTDGDAFDTHVVMPELLSELCESLCGPYLAGQLDKSATRCDAAWLDFMKRPRGVRYSVNEALPRLRPR